MEETYQAETIYRALSPRRDAFVRLYQDHITFTGHEVTPVQSARMRFALYESDNINEPRCFISDGESKKKNINESRINEN